MLKKWMVFALLWTVSAAGANELPEADVYFIGEAHDNPTHHEEQGRLTAQIGARAVVFEMIPDGVRHELSEIPSDEALAERLDWWGRGGKDVALYRPVLEASKGLPLYGALIDRPAARAAMETGIAKAFGPDATRYGLAVPLDEGEQAEREAYQMEAHCNAMPEEMLSVLVSLQRLRDAALARAVLQAFEEVGGPIVVITGNGHARKDRGAPRMLTQVAPSLRVVTIGQGEEGNAPDGVFDAYLNDAPVPEREDPCAAFK